MPREQGADAGEQVAQVIGQIRVVALDQKLFPNGRVLAVHRVLQQVVAHGVGAVFFRHFKGINDVAQALAHLLLIIVSLQEAADIEVLIQRHPSRFEHGRPKHRVGLENVLADQVLGHRPIRVVARAVGKAECGSVVDQGIDPHVRHVLGVPRQLNAPGHPAFGPRNRQVANRLAEQGQHLVSVPGGTNKIRVVADVVAQPIAVLFHAKEVVALAATLRCAQVIGAQAVDQLLVGEEALAAHAVQPLVFVVVDVPGCVNRL